MSKAEFSHVWLKCFEAPYWFWEPVYSAFPTAPLGASAIRNAENIPSDTNKTKNMEEEKKCAGSRKASFFQAVGYGF
jgi:hypothetical protein